jgi:hypothetical protein
VSQQTATTLHNTTVVAAFFALGVMTLLLANCPDKGKSSGDWPPEAKQRLYDEVTGKRRSAQGRGLNTGDD